MKKQYDTPRHDPLHIRHFREKAGLSRGELADKLGITVELMHDYENGYASPDLITAQKIAEILGVSLSDMAKGE